VRKKEPEGLHERTKGAKKRMVCNQSGEKCKTRRKRVLPKGGKGAKRHELTSVKTTGGREK